MSNHVNIKVGADGSGAFAVFNKVKHEANKMGEEVVSGLKEAVIGVVGAAAVGELVHSMVEFAESIEQTAKKLGMTTDRVQELRMAVRHAGKDLSAFDLVFRNVDKFASKALVKGSKESNIANKLGLSENDLQHLNKDELLRRVLESAGKMDRTKGEALLGGVVGSKNAGWLYGIREDVLKKRNNLVSGDDLSALVEFEHTLEDLGDVVKFFVIPYLTKFGEWLADFIATRVDQSKDLSQMETDAAGIAFNMGKKEVGWWKRVNAYTDAQSKLIGVVSGTPEEKAEFYKQAKRDYIVKLYGQEVYDELMKTHKPPEGAESWKDRLAERKEERRKEREQEHKIATGEVDRERPVTKDPKISKILDNDIKTNNAFLKVGNLMGVDTNYRLERLSETTNELLRQIVINTTPGEDEPEMPEESDGGFNA